VTGAERERAQPQRGEGFTDAVMFSFGDRDAGVYGLARLGISGPQGSALAVLFSGGEPAGMVAEGGVELSEGAGWETLELPGLSATVDVALQRWRVRMDAPESEGFELIFEAISDPADFAAGGMAGYEQLCRVSGTAAGRPVDCLGQRGHSWGAPDWSRIDRTRSVAAWLEDGSALALGAIRPAGAADHAAEEVWATLIDAGGVLPVAEPRLSTTYDGDGHQRRAGIELWMDEEEGFPHRGSGHVLCGSSLELGSLRLDCSFFAWRLDGREGVGRYDVLRRAT